MKILIIGGTIFLGRRLRGDCNTDVSALEGGRWDAVIDTCGYVPGGVTRVMNALDREGVGHYTFVSSVSVYAQFARKGSDEGQDAAEA